MDQARATARVSDAQRLPQISVNGSVARARTGGVQTGGGALTTTQSTATLGSGLSWELDLWGRLKETSRAAEGRLGARTADRSDEHTSELQSLMRISYAVFCLKKKITTRNTKCSIIR